MRLALHPIAEVACRKLAKLKEKVAVVAVAAVVVEAVVAVVWSCGNEDVSTRWLLFALLDCSLFAVVGFTCEREEHAEND